MPLYLVEVYVPRSAADDARSAGHRARAAAEALACDSIAIRYVRTTFLPEDETCFHVFEAPSSEVVTQVATRADLGRTRVIEIVDASDSNGESRT
jgi:hypothetical protein